MRIELIDENYVEIKTLFDLQFDPFSGKEKVSIRDRDEGDKYRDYIILDSEVFIVNNSVSICYTLAEVTE